MPQQVLLDVGRRLGPVVLLFFPEKLFHGAVYGGVDEGGDGAFVRVVFLQPPQNEDPAMLVKVAVFSSSPAVFPMVGEPGSNQPTDVIVKFGFDSPPASSPVHHQLAQVPAPLELFRRGLPPRSFVSPVPTEWFCR
jgi:hypothetical protein